jgi:hypothetical protein
MREGLWKMKKEWVRRLRKRRMLERGGEGRRVCSVRW